MVPPALWKSSRSGAIAAISAALSSITCGGKPRTL
jgi:hypothetical protein